ncbi:MAG: DsbA family protein [Gammaproteobacteria bacterium]|nr:MAG: DsbA family protein [Gammaproteobacteria bacterium]
MNKRLSHTLYYYHDPMCSWCWGYRPTAEKLFASLPANIRLEKVLGGLAPDSDEPMPQHLRLALPDAWRRIHAMLGTEFNFDFWTDCKPRRSTYPSCRAVIAAGRQNHADEMTRAIQHAYYLRAMNPSDRETLVTLAEELHLDKRRFVQDLKSAETEAEFQRQLEFTRRSPTNGFPSLAIEFNGQLVAVKQDYKTHSNTLEHIAMLVSEFEVSELS